ncbi:MAG TPA: HU family DNA-binding protein [Micromonosporaceae bacterium]|jgi:DNA-binding protein HU-beta
MNKGELIEKLSKPLGDQKTSSKALDAVVNEIESAVSSGEKVNISGFGVFERRDRAARTARNPRTGEPINVKKTAVPAFRPGTSFKNLVSGNGGSRTQSNGQGQGGRGQSGRAQAGQGQNSRARAQAAPRGQTTTRTVKAQTSKAPTNRVQSSPAQSSRTHTARASSHGSQSAYAQSAYAGRKAPSSRATRMAK